MLAIIFSWFVIFFVCSAYGHLLVSAYNSKLKQSEEYNWLDISLIGMCLVSFIVSITSFFTPVNEVLLLILVVVALGYLLFNQRFRRGLFSATSNFMRKLSPFYLIVGILLVCFVLFVTIWAPDDYDPAFYHYQNIVWNEHFSVVPGLANIEDRFGFNSNVLLLYALFSFKSIFSDYIFSLQSLFVVLLFLWILSEINRNKGSLCRIVILFVFFIFVVSLPSAVSNTSTDVIPNLVAFYLIVRILLYPTSLKSSYLLYFVLPITMVTFKVSSVFLCILSLYLLVLLIKDKDYKRLFFLLGCALCITIPWLVRNVIVSGYLVYPMFEIDLFSFDWKVPLETAENQRKYMAIVANERHWFRLLRTIKVIFTKGEFSFSEDYFYHAIIQLFVIFCGLLSIITLIIKKIKKERIGVHIYLVALIIFFTLVYWFSSARDYRFVYGTMLTVVAFPSFLLFPKLSFNKYITYISVFLVTILACCFSVKWSGRYYKQIRTYEKYPICRMLYTPYSVNDKLQSFDYSRLEPHEIGDNTIIYISRYYGGCSYTIFPTVAFFESDSKAQDIRTVEMRGATFQKGFRTKSSK